MRSVPLPILDGLDLMYHPGLRLLRCCVCNIFVQPRSAASHSSNVHWFNMSHATRKQLEADFPNPEWTKPYPLMEGGAPLPPIDDLPIVSGYQCVLDECGYITDNRGTLNSHHTGKHRCRTEEEYFKTVNITKLVVSNPPTWIIVASEPTKPHPIKRDAVKRDASVKPEYADVPEEPVDDLSTGTTAVDGFVPRHAVFDHSPTTSPKPLHESHEPDTAPYPTLEQFLTPCESHPVLDATGYSMLLHPGLGLIKCGICHTFLLPFQVAGHFRSSHDASSRTYKWHAITEMFPDPQWRRPFPELAIGDGFPPVHGLPVVPAFQCTYDDCGFIASSVWTIKAHFTAQHPETSYHHQFLEIRASKFMSTRERQNVWIPITDEGPEEAEPSDPATAAPVAATPASKKKPPYQTPRPAPTSTPQSSRPRQPSKRKVEAERVPSPPAGTSNRSSEPSGSRKRKRVEDPVDPEGPSCSRTSPFVHDKKSLNVPRFDSGSWGDGTRFGDLERFRETGDGRAGSRGQDWYASSSPRCDVC